MTEHYRLVKHIETKLSSYVSGLQISNDRDYYDENKEAEYFFREPLSLLFDACIKNANDEKRNFPGIDLWDREKRICFQITTTRTKAKVQHTLDEFLDNNLDDDFDRLIILIVTTEKLPSFSKVTLKRDFDFDPQRDVWTVGTLVSKFDALPYDERDKLQAFSDYLDRELPGGEQEAPHLCLPPSSALGKDSFVGRDSEKAQIQARIDGGEKLIVLSGLGGMGKTELAVRFGQDYKDGAVYFIQFKDSFTHTVAKMAPGIRPELSKDALSRPDEDLCADVLKILESCVERDILIIDNVDADKGRMSDLMKDPIYKKLSSLNLRLLFTTRFERSQSVGVDRMADEILYKIFDKHSAPVDRRQMKYLIDAVNGHTLTIDLIARTLADNWEPVTSEEMLDALQNSTLAEGDFAEVETYYNQSPEQVQIYQHLRTVFKVAKIPEAEQNILRCATLLPQTGMNYDLFRDSLSEDWRKTLAPLGRRGWLKKEGELLTIHPVIRLVCREELKPTDETCGNFLNALWGQLGRDEYDRVKFAQLAEVFAQAADHLEDVAAKAQWLNYSGYLYDDLGQHQKEKELYEKHLPALEARLHAHPALATAYNNMGTTYSALGDHRKALEYQLKDLAICEKVLPQDHPDLAASYNNVGLTYGYLGDYRKALEYLEKTLQIQKKELPPEHPDLAAPYNNVGYTYGELMGDHRKALEYKMKALRIFEKVLPPEHPDLAASYNTVGTTYGEIGDHCKALEYKLKALAIREKVLPSEHPDLADSYSNVGITYDDLGDRKKTLEYNLKALAIREKVLPPEHPDLARSYNNVGCAYNALGDHNKALVYQLKDLAICKKVLPDDHPSLATSYDNVGYTYGALGDHRKAMEYKLKALAIREKVLPPEHPDLASSYNNIGITYAAMGNYPLALEYLKNALEILEKAFPVGDPYTESTRRGVMQYQMMVNMQKSGFNFANPLASKFPFK